MTLDLKQSDRFALGICVTYFLFCVAYLVLEFWGESGPTSSSESDTAEADHPTDERVLDRLERGETVRIPRWHGHELEVSAELVVDADALDDGEEADDAE